MIEALVRDCAVNPFLQGFCVSLVRPGILIFLALVLAGFGRGFGLPLLFWRPRARSTDPEAGKTEPAPLQQFLVGIGVGALVWQVLLSGYLFEEFATNYTLDRPPFCEARPNDPAIGLGAAHPVEVQTEFPGRFRYDPLAFETSWLYAISVLGGALTASLAVAVVGMVLPVLMWLPWLRPAWKPFSVRTTRTPLPFSFYLPVGVAAGLIGLSLVTWGGIQSPMSRDLGSRLTSVGGWGSGSGRQTAVLLRNEAARSTKRVDQGLVSDDPQYTKEREEAKAKAMIWFAPYFPVYGAFVLNFVLIFVVSIILMVLPRRFNFFSPAVGIILLLNLLILSSTVLNYFSPIPSEFVLIVLGGVVVFSGRAFKLKFPNMGANAYREPVDLAAYYQKRAEFEALSAPPPACSNLLDSRAIPFGPSASPDSPKPRLAIVCVSGGGSRAAAWTMKSLLELERAFADPPRYDASLTHPPVAFPYQIRLVTGASGGMIAASYYVASLQPPNAGPSVQRVLTPQQLFDGVCADFLTPITHTLVARDIPSLFVPFHLGPTDRGIALEHEWETALHGQLAQTFAAMRPGEAAGWRPSLIFSPMMVEDGRQLFISNLDLHQVVRNSAWILGERGANGQPSPLNPFNPRGRRLLSREGLEFFRVFPGATAFRLSTAARMSASFPYILPAAYLPTNPPRRVVDAGYYDNYGVGIAASWLFNHTDWIKEHTSGVVIIQIRDAASGETRRREAPADSFPSVPTAGLHWLTSPPEGLWGFRQAAHTFRNDNLLHLLGDFFDSQGFPREFLSTISLEFPGGEDVALSFTLAEGERESISAAVTQQPFRGQVKALLDWWHTPLPRPAPPSPPPAQPPPPPVLVPPHPPSSPRPPLS